MKWFYRFDVAIGFAALFIFFVVLLWIAKQPGTNYFFPKVIDAASLFLFLAGLMQGVLLGIASLQSRSNQTKGTLETRKTLYQDPDKMMQRTIFFCVLGIGIRLFFTS